MDLMSFPSQPRGRGVQLDDIITGLGMLGTVLALPRSVEAQQTENEQMRAMLTGSGIPEEQIKAATPEPALRWLSPKQGGFTGKVLGGVGDVGAILSTVVGKPVKAPRMDMADLATAARFRSQAAKDKAQKDLEDVLANPKSTDREIGLAAVRAGSVEGGLRYLRGGGAGANQPSSIFAARRMLRDPSITPERRQELQQIVDDYENYQEELDKRRSDLIAGRQPPHYDPGQQQQMRHDELVKERAAEAARRNYKEGTPEYRYFMDHGYDPPVRQPPSPEEQLNKEIDREQRRRDAMAKDPVLRDQIPTEPVEDTARRNLAERQKAGAAVKGGAPPPPPPTPPAPTPGSLQYNRAARRASGTIGGVLGAELAKQPSETPVTTSTPATSTTTTTQPPADDDAQAQAFIDNFDTSSLSPEGQAAAHQLADAIAKGMPIRQAANWAMSLR